MVDRVRRKVYSLPYLNGLFSVPAPPLRTRERRGFFSEFLAEQESTSEKPFQGHLDRRKSV
jgi:hypothetical protein